MITERVSTFLDGTWCGGRERGTLGSQVKVSHLFSLPGR